MSTELEQLRCGYETRLFNTAQQCVAQIFLGADRRQEMFEVRRRGLLGNSVRITEQVLPEVARRYQACLELLGSQYTGDLFVQSSPEYNASVLADGNRFDVVVNSALLNDFTLDELTFVIGHELGHVLFKHSGLRIHEALNNHPNLDAADARSMLKWSRAAEISADRVGLLCCGKLEPATNALFKTASGLQNVSGQNVIRSLRQQYDELVAHISSVGGAFDWMRTHPMIPIRFKAIEMSALDIVSLRRNFENFSWSGFRRIDAQIGDLLDSLEVEGGPQKGLHSEGGQTCAIIGLLYVALADGKLEWRPRAFIHDTHMTLRSKLPVAKMLDAAQRDAKDAFDSALDELRSNKESLSPADAKTVVLLAAVMCHLQDATPTFGQRVAIQKVAEAIGLSIGDAQEALANAPGKGLRDVL